MRWFLLLLLILNAVFFMWQRSEIGFHRLDSLQSREGHLPSAKGNLSLLSELGASSSSPAESPVRECWLLGPLTENELDIEPVAGVRRLQDSVITDADFWVYLGPYDNSDQALAKHRELQAKGEDSYAVSGGALKDAVSLGVFSSEQRANSHAAAMKNKGYPAQVQRVGEPEVRHWLWAEGEPGSASFSAQINYLSELSGDDGRLSKKNCNLIASYNEFD